MTAIALLNYLASGRCDEADELAARPFPVAEHPVRRFDNLRWQVSRLAEQDFLL